MPLRLFGTSLRSIFALCGTDENSATIAVGWALNKSSAGDRWPTLPVNYIGFRYRGRLQSVHHVNDWEIVADKMKAHVKWPRFKRDHFVYRLGPPMHPSTPMPNGKIYPAQHVKCALDTLLSGAFKTVREARDETQRRYRAMDDEL